jgi:corrinoid protein of di/trimethylamine methyltransferase
LDTAALNDIRQAVLTYDAVAAKNIAQHLVDSDADAFEVIEQGLAPALKEVGAKFETGEIFLPHLMMAATAMEEAVTILETKLTAAQRDTFSKAKVILGTVEGDVHNIGKNIVGMMLKASGFTVIDVGVDVAVAEFVARAESEQADIIAVSALMTFTMNQIGTLIEYLNTNHLRDKYKVVCGGGALSAEWAKEIGADGYAADASKAVHLLESLVAVG